MSEGTQSKKERLSDSANSLILPTGWTSWSLMITEIGAFAAKTHLSKLLDEVEAGNTIYITRHGKRVAEIHPVKPTKKAVRGCAKGAPGTFYMAPDFDAPLEEFKEYM